MRWVICDIDGTLANIRHRLHHIQPPQEPRLAASWKPNWDAFNAAMGDDEPKRDIIELVWWLAAQYPIMLVTGRFEQYRVVTERWLYRHAIVYNYLYMRPNGDYRSDHIIKEDIYLAHIAAPKRDVVCVIDDRQKVVDMWRSKGLTVLQCQKGDY